MEHHPIASNSILCLNLWIAGDALAQYSEHRLLHHGGENETPVSETLSAQENKSLTPAVASESTKIYSTEASTEWKFDYRRTAECASYGAFFSGPLIAVWYPYLDKLCERFALTQRYGVWAAPIAKVVADEFLMDPPTLLVFYGYMNICEGGTWETYQHKLQQEFLRSWLTSLAVWPVVLLGTFRYLPVYAQAPFINACCIVWDGFLSHRNAAVKLEEAKLKKEGEATIDNQKEERDCI